MKSIIIGWEELMKSRKALRLGLTEKSLMIHGRLINQVVEKLRTAWISDQNYPFSLMTECGEPLYFICESLHISGIEVPKQLVVGQTTTLKCHVMEILCIHSNG